MLVTPLVVTAHAIALLLLYAVTTIFVAPFTAPHESALRTEVANLRLERFGEEAKAPLYLGSGLGGEGVRVRAEYRMPENSSTTGPELETRLRAAFEGAGWSRAERFEYSGERIGYFKTIKGECFRADIAYGRAMGGYVYDGRGPLDGFALAIYEYHPSCETES